MNSSPVEILRNLRIPIAGSLTLAADLYRCAGSSPQPAIVVTLPYLKDGVAGSSLAWYLERFALAGFSTLLVDLRGCGGSEGSAREPFDGADADDGVAAVEWAARQPWCDGRVGFWGASYGGMMALRTASRRPAALRAIVAIECAANAGTEFFRPDGIRGGMSPLGLWPTGDLAMQLLPPLHRDAQGDWSRIWKRRLEHMRPRLFDYLRRPSGDRFFNDSAIDVEAIKVPALIVAGWRDFFCAPSIAVHRRLRVPKKLIVGPWTHLMPDQSPVAPLDLTSITIAWWRRWLRDEPNAIEREPAVTTYVQGLERWHGFDTWPPAAADHEWFAAAHGTLEQAPSTVFAPIVQAVDPALGFRDHLWGFPIPGLPHDGRDDDRAGISFTTRPLDATTVIAGAPRVRVSVGANSIGVTWVAARLSMVGTDGSSRLISSGATTCSGFGSVDIMLADTCIEVARGQRLCLTIAAADFPRLWPQADARVLELDAAPKLELPLVNLKQDAQLSPALHAVGAPLAPLALSLLPEWRVTEDLLTSTITLTLGQTGSMYTPGHEAVLELASRVSAAVSRHNPGASTVTGRARASARWKDQPEITVEGELQVSSNAAKATAQIHEGGRLIFERTWELDSIP